MNGELEGRGPGPTTYTQVAALASAPLSPPALSLGDTGEEGRGRATKIESAHTTQDPVWETPKS